MVLGSGLNLMLLKLTTVYFLLKTKRWLMIAKKLDWNEQNYFVAKNTAAGYLKNAKGTFLKNRILYCSDKHQAY